MGRQGKNQNQLGLFKSRTVLVFTLFAGCYFLLAGRLVYLQAARHTYFEKMADEYRVSKSLLPARRGLIYDRNGDLLAENLPASAIYADPKMVADPAGTAVKLAPIIGMDPARLTVLLTPKNKRCRFVSLKRHMPTTVGDAVKAANLQGIGVDVDTMRAYPNGSLAAQVLGFTNPDGTGVEGVEHSQDKLLTGHDGVMVAEIDKLGRFLPGTERRFREPENGSDVTLTIDRNIQQAADAALLKTVTDHKAESGVVVVMDPRNGDILALSNYPNYDPNHPRPAGAMDPKTAATYEAKWRDGAVSNLYEPGSTMKTITLSAVLQNEGMQAMDRYVTCTGQLQVGNHIIHCAPDPPYYGVHGRENLRGILKESCNIGMAMFGMQLGSHKLYDMEQKFGFLQYPDSGLPGEQRSWVQSPDKFNRFTGKVGWSEIQLANIAFGQGISVTPLQLATAYCAIANGGTLVKPHIVKSIQTGQKLVDVPTVNEGTIMTPEVAAMVRSCLGTVVQEGTGKPAQIAGFDVGGKTGSAQVAGPHGYEAGQYVGSFIGMVPLNKPRLVILCAVFKPQGVHWGAVVAAPVVHDLAKISMLQMHVTPDDPGAPDANAHKMAKRTPGSSLTTPVQAGQITQL